ncbi:OLC1v1004061C1 [Oldenlandia corymbosa var. corymbosa]|uniref:OLC1v1004061C1 n=1 Tax=Oldenlandia corymbosa var. corymbosa TaxID=529605 RepID=A0AAV1DBD1_OLDCO|nr:OLC1v1004061C1 [Oldenlandia corymbosa var. corymbosa]
MEYSTSDTTATTITTSSSSPKSSSRSVSPTSSSSPPRPPTTPPPPTQPPVAVVVSPCAACKILRRRCAEKCVLAPYFPPNDPIKFTTAHRVFGASNIIKFLQELPESQRADAVSSMVYEANARLRDPVYGSAGAICQLQKQVNELQAQLAKAQAEIINMQCQQANLMALICMEMAQTPQQLPASPSSISSMQIDTNNFIINGTQQQQLGPSFQTTSNNNLNFFDDNHPGSLWETALWT